MATAKTSVFNMQRRYDFWPPYNWLAKPLTTHVGVFCAPLLLVRLPPFYSEILQAASVIYPLINSTGMLCRVGVVLEST